MRRGVVERAWRVVARVMRRVGGGPLGRRGERAAARRLRREGYRVLARNALVPMGEADLVCVAPDRRTIVLVEVKTRRVSAEGRARPAPELTVHARKQAKLRAIARHLRRANQWGDRPMRIDVVAVDWPEEGAPVMRHHLSVVSV